MKAKYHAKRARADEPLTPLVVLALLLTVPAALAITPQQALDRAQSSRSFVAAPRASFILQTPDAGGQVQLILSVRAGDFDSVQVDGPGRCVANRAMSGGTMTLDCGWLDAGRHRVSLRFDGGRATGSLRASGAIFPVA